MYSMFTDINVYVHVCLKGLVSIVVSILALGAWARNPTHHLTTSDLDRLQDVLEQPFTDLKSAYFSIVGLSKLGASVPDSDVSSDQYQRDISYVYKNTYIYHFVLYFQEACNFITSNLDTSSIESLFYVAEASRALSSCEV